MYLKLVKETINIHILCILVVVTKFNLKNAFLKYNKNHDSKMWD